VKILLLNDNPVVSKLVTLSSQKTSDELECIHSIEEVDGGQYDLLVIDDALYTDGLLDDFSSKIDFKKSLFIMAKNSQLPDGFTNTIKKPFLPTDMVELFSFLNKEIAESPSQEMNENIFTSAAVSDEELLESFDLDDDLEELEGLDDILDGDELGVLDELDELEGLEDLEGLESLDLGELEELEDLDEAHELILDAGESLDTHEELMLDDAEELLDENEDFILDEDEESDGVLDKEELQEVQDLLDDAEEDELEAMDEINLDANANADEERSIPQDELEDTLAEAEDELFGLEDELFEDEEPDAAEEKKAEPEEEEVDFEDELFGLEDELSEDEEQEVEEEKETEPEETMSLQDELLDLEDEEIDDVELEAKIEEAMSALSEEDLEEEIELDDEISQLPATDFDDAADAFASLNQRDLKLAVGEEVEDIALEELVYEPELHFEETLESLEDEQDEAQEEALEITEDEEADEEQTQHEGVEALKNLLAALSDKKVAASLKGMTISINITLGEK
jgi:uncharacterized membrane protein